MYYEKSEYERLITESPLFALDKEKERSKYRREALKLVEYLYCYLMVTNEAKYEPYGGEIVDVAKRCIKNYDPDTGVFLHYFNSAWKAEYGHLVGKELVKETYHGIHFTEEQSRNYRKYMKLTQSMGMDTSSEDFDRKVAEAMSLSMSELSALKEMVDCRPIYGTILNKYDEEYSFIDQIDSGTYVDAGIIETEKIAEYLDIIQLVFNGLQERQKSMMAMLITARMSLLIRDDTVLLELFRSKSYFNASVFQEYLQRSEAIGAKEISEQLGVAEASTSRSWKNFKEKLRSAGLKRR